MKTTVSKLIVSGLFAFGLTGANSAFAFDPGAVTVGDVCVSGGVKKGPDASGKTSIKCDEPDKGSWKYDPKTDTATCKGTTKSCPKG